MTLRSSAPNSAAQTNMSHAAKKPFLHQNNNTHRSMTTQGHFLPSFSVASAFLDCWPSISCRGAGAPQHKRCSPKMPRQSNFFAPVLRSSWAPPAPQKPADTWALDEFEYPELTRWITSDQTGVSTLISQQGWGLYHGLFLPVRGVFCMIKVSCCPWRWCKEHTVTT